MKFVSYSKDGGEIRAGLSIDGKIVDLADGAKQIGATLPSNVVEILALGETGMTIAGDVADATATGNIATTPESDVTLEAAIQTPPTIFLLAGNYQSHLIEGVDRQSKKTRSTRAHSSNQPRRSSAPVTRS